MAETIQSLNRLINCIDPGKDAMILSVLTDKIHGAFLKNSVYTPLFKLDKLANADVVQGVGDKKDFLKKKVDSAFRLKDFPVREITRLKYASDGNAMPRLSGYNLAYDNGSGLDELSSEYRMVITPASIIDRACRDKNPRNPITALNKPSDFLPELIRALDLDACLVSLRYEGVNAGKYRFTFKTTIPGYETFTAEYKDNKKVEPITFEAEYCANEKKNAFIFEHWKKADELSKIKVLVLLKELGDTLQVMWLKQLIQQEPLQADKTALCTSDTAVWLRSLINEVSCVFSVKGGTSTLYPVALNEGQKQLAITIIKNQDLELLKWINQDVINRVRECVRRSTAANFEFADIEVEPTAETRRIITRILKSIEGHLVKEAAEILKRLGPLFGSELQEYRRILDSFAFSHAFILGKKNSIKWQKSFKAFLPKQKTFPKIEVNVNLFQTLAKQRVPEMKTVKLILRDIPLVAAGGRPLPAGGGRPLARGGGMDEAEYEMILKTNSAIPGFLTYFIMTYFPELFYIAFSYDLAATGQFQETKHFYKSVFQYEITTGAFSHYEDLDEEYRLQTGEPGEEALLNKLDAIAKRACTVLHAANEYTRGKEELTLFEGAGKDFLWILKYSKRAELPPGISDLHWDALCYYEQLLRADIGLCMLSTRGTESPLDSVEFIQPFVESPQRTPPIFKLGVAKPKVASPRVKHKLKGVGTRKMTMANRASIARAQRRSANIKRRRGLGSTRRATQEAHS